MRPCNADLIVVEHPEAETWRQHSLSIQRESRSFQSLDGNMRLPILALRRPRVFCATSGVAPKHRRSHSKPGVSKARSVPTVVGPRMLRSLIASADWRSE